VGPASLALSGLIALLVLLPTRRLQLAGWSARSLAAYYLAVWLLAVVVAVVPVPARFLVPFLLVAYLAPFVTLRDGLDRLMGRPPRSGTTRVEPPPSAGGGDRPIKDVTPPDLRGP
jgi:hypothetical protein